MLRRWFLCGTVLFGLGVKSVSVPAVVCLRANLERDILTSLLFKFNGVCS
jgi:hypothetical protein